jgi:type IV secretory pathway VirB10-like protein
MPARRRSTYLTVPYADRHDWVTKKMAAHLVGRREGQVEGWCHTGYVETCLHNGRRLVSLSSCRYHISRAGTQNRRFIARDRRSGSDAPEASQAPPETPQPAQTIDEAPQPPEASQAPPEAPQTPPAPTSESTDDLRGPTDATRTHQRVDRRSARRSQSTALDARAAGATAGRSEPRQHLHPVCCRCAAPAVAPAAISTRASDRARRAPTGQRARDQQGCQPTGSRRLLAPTADPSRVVSVALLASDGVCHR